MAWMIAFFLSYLRDARVTNCLFSAFLTTSFSSPLTFFGIYSSFPSIPSPPLHQPTSTLLSSSSSIYRTTHLQTFQVVFPLLFKLFKKSQPSQSYAEALKKIPSRFQSQVFEFFFMGIKGRGRSCWI